MTNKVNLFSVSLRFSQSANTYSDEAEPAASLLHELSLYRTLYWPPNIQITTKDAPLN